MKTRHIIAWLCVVFMVTCKAERRERILFVNEAPESVLVSIGHAPLPPLAKNRVDSGARSFFFPSEMSYEAPLYIWLESATAELHYKLSLTVNLRNTLMRSCRSFGELILQREDYTVDSIGASVLEKGFILVYTKEYELVIRPYDIARRPRSLRKRTECKGCSRPSCNKCVWQKS